jgi:SAM-dependent methyltransferase
MRLEATGILIDWIKANSPSIKSIAIVGGSSGEPELVQLLRIYPNAITTFLGVESSPGDKPFLMFDLNEPIRIHQTFDIVICAQVLEHVWNLENAIQNLTNIVEPKGGILWLNCPASNMVHGSPEYFSAGYTPRMLSKLLELYSFEVLTADSIGSRRLYFFTHALQYWPTRLELAHPVITYRPLRSYGRNLIQETVRGFAGRLYSLFLSNKKLFGSQFSTETFVLSKPKESSRP